VSAPLLSIVIPAYNEERRLPPTLDSIYAFLTELSFSFEVIVVDDGSDDQTAAVARKTRSRQNIRVLRLPVNQGKGAAVQKGLLATTGEYVLIMDADNATRIDELAKLLPVARWGFPVVIGSRYLQRDSIKIKQPWYRILISRLGNRLIQIVLLPGIKDTQCGFKLFTSGAAKQIASLITMKRFSFDMEMLTIARSLGEPIKEVPVNWYDAPGTRLRPIKASLQTFRDLLLIRWKRSRGAYRMRHSEIS